MKLFVVLILSLGGLLYAKGVSAATIIQNSATLDFSISGESFSIQSNVDRSVVEQLLDVSVSWMDTADVAVSKGDKKRVLTYKIVNNGNGEDRYTLIAKEQVSKSQFVTEVKKVYIDMNANFQFDSNDNERKTITLAPDEEGLVFLVTNIALDLNASSLSRNFANLKAFSRRGGSGEVGRVHTNRGIGGVDAIDGLSGGESEDEGIFQLLIANVVLDKNVTSDENDLFTVLIDVRVEGDGLAEDVRIEDQIPNEMIYVSHSLELDNLSLTDTDDTDAGRYKRKYRERKALINVELGDLDTDSSHIIKYNLRLR
jgi:hypothetical protein